MRTERPDLPAIPNELVRAERLKPLTAVPKAGDEVAISRNVLAELYERLGEAVGAIERGNNRAAGVSLWWRCADAVLRTGKAPEGCR